MKQVQFPDSVWEFSCPRATGLPAPVVHYVRLLSVANPDARRFYEAEALRAAGPFGNWSAIACGLVALATWGAGAISLDAWRE